MTYRIVDLTKQLNDGRYVGVGAFSRRIIVVHRIWLDYWSLDDPHTALELARKFIDDAEVGQWTGMQLAYTAMIDMAGHVNQCLRDSEKGYHARKYNADAYGIGVMGDMRQRDPKLVQEGALISLCADLCLANGIDPLGYTDVCDDKGETLYSVPSVAGHDELPAASKDPRKRCPGQHLNMHHLRQHIDDDIKERARQDLMRRGWVL